MNAPSADISELTQHELVSAYFDGMVNCIEFVQTEIIPVLNGQLNLSDREEAILGIFYRMHATGSSLTRLNSKLDFSVVASICRTLFELIIDLKFLCSSQSTQHDLDRFRAFAEIERFHKAGKLLEFQAKNPDLERDAYFNGGFRKHFVEALGKRDAIEAKVISLWGSKKNGKPNYPDHWTGLSVRARAATLGPIYEQEYLEIYSILSWYVHAGNASYSGFSEQALEGVYGVSMNISRRMYIEGLLLCSRVYSLNKAVENFSHVIEFMKNAPERILIELGMEKARGS